MGISLNEASTLLIMKTLKEEGLSIVALMTIFTLLFALITSPLICLR